MTTAATVSATVARLWAPRVSLAASINFTGGGESFHEGGVGNTCDIAAGRVSDDRQTNRRTDK